MKCLGCYTEVVKQEYCLSCRKKLFDKKRISFFLDIDKPRSGNYAGYQELTKRFSISGVQLKYSLRIENEKLVFCDKGGAYLLKPLPTNDQLEMMAQAPENEHLTMQMASQLFGIKTAENALIYFKDGTPAYLTKRFDYSSTGIKLKQEDFAQISGRTKDSHGAEYKYDGSYLEIGELIKRYVPAYMITIENYFKIILFNYIICNGDAHLKNFSIMSDASGELSLSPAYDLMSTILHTPNERDTALDLYPKDHESEFYSRFGYYGRADFEAFAKKIGLIETRYQRIIDEFLNKKNDMIQFVDHSFLSEAAKLAYKRNIADRVGRITQYLFA